MTDESESDVGNKLTPIILAVVGVVTLITIIISVVVYKIINQKKSGAESTTEMTNIKIEEQEQKNDSTQNQ